MAVRWLESCDSYTSTSNTNILAQLQLAGNYGAVGQGFAFTGGKYGPMRFAQCGLLRPVPSGVSALRIAFRYFQGPFVGTCGVSKNFQGASLLNVPVLGDYVVLTPSAIEVCNGATATVQASFSRGISSGTDEWIEVEITSTKITVVKDGLQIISWSGAVTMPTTFYGVFASGSSALSSVAGYIDDIVWHDNDTSDSTNDFDQFPIGPQRAQFAVTTGAGSNTQFTPASGTNYAAVQGTTWGGGVGNTSTTTGQKDSFAVTDSNFNSYKFLGILARVAAFDSNSGGSSVKALIKSSASEKDSAALPLFITTSQIASVLAYQDPATVAPWTQSGINAMEVGYSNAT